MTATYHKDVDILNQQLRGQIAAVETYEQAIRRFSDPVDQTLANALTRLRDEHARSVESLRTRVLTHGGTPASGAGVWGVFANAVEGAATLLGPKTALAALKKGEQLGIEDYEKAMKDDRLAVESRMLINNELLPRCQEHLLQLDAILNQLDEKKG